MWGIGESITSRVDTETTSKSRKNISQEGINKIIYDIMSSDQGLASLAGGENSSGGFGSTTKGLMAQDLTVKLAGEIANITAEEEKTSMNDQQLPGDTLSKTVICTYLRDIGAFDRNLYEAGVPYFNTLSARTVIGYHFWAEPIVKRMKKSDRLCRFFIPIVNSRYQMIVNKKFGVLGAITLYILQPLCYLTGLLLGVPNGRYILQ